MAYGTFNFRDSIVVPRRSNRRVRRRHNSRLYRSWKHRLAQHFIVRSFDTTSLLGASLAFAAGASPFWTMCDDQQFRRAAALEATLTIATLWPAICACKWKRKPIW